MWLIITDDILSDSFPLKCINHSLKCVPIDEGNTGLTGFAMISESLGEKPDV